MSVFSGLWARGKAGLRVLAAADSTLDSLSSGRCRLDPLLATMSLPGGGIGHNLDNLKDCT